MSAKGARFLLAPCMRCLHRDPVSHFEVPIPKDTTKKASVWAGKRIALCAKGKEHGCGFFVCFDTIHDEGPLVVKTNDYSLFPGGVHADDDVMVQDGLIHYSPSGRFTHIEMSDADADGDDDSDYQAPAPVSKPTKPVATSSSDPEVIDLTKARDCKFCHRLKVPGVCHACKVSNKGTIVDVMVKDISLVSANLASIVIENALYVVFLLLSTLSVYAILKTDGQSASQYGHNSSSGVVTFASFRRTIKRPLLNGGLAMIGTVTGEALCSTGSAHPFDFL
ncbi:hypothetical protein AAF712_011178 [Marasmius tenuissimus]|uniref:Uncharacterized protein n=1 Tax=Marasmius tenuissimus TaxID=585030 RepID=A0ABR2ZL90_9AGAR